MPRPKIFGAPADLRTFWSCAGQAHSCRPPQCVERRDRSNGILFEASACLKTQLVPVSREAPRRDAHEVDRLGDVLDLLLGHRSMPMKDARPRGTYLDGHLRTGRTSFAGATATLGRFGTEKYRAARRCSPHLRAVGSRLSW
jgi:hypothetical protein